MYPKPIQKLIELFTKLPGIGPRQAARFAFFALKEKEWFGGELTAALIDLKRDVTFCGQCFRSIENTNGSLCSFCRDPRRAPELIAVVERESDMQNLERTGAFSGQYHVLNGVVAPLDSTSPARLHLKELHARIKKYLDEKGTCEVVLATNTTTEGDTTALYIERILEPLKKHFAGLKVSRLGRGLSFGSELEYADEMTLRNAFTNRK